MGARKREEKITRYRKYVIVSFMNKNIYLGHTKYRYSIQCIQFCSPLGTDSTIKGYAADTTTVYYVVLYFIFIQNGRTRNRKVIDLHLAS